jgi:hypothetical protein
LGYDRQVAEGHSHIDKLVVGYLRKKLRWVLGWMTYFLLPVELPCLTTLSLCQEIRHYKKLQHKGWCETAQTVVKITHQPSAVTLYLLHYSVGGGDALTWLALEQREDAHKCN